MLIKVTTKKAIHFEEVTPEELKEITKNLFSISASGMWNGEREVFVILDENNELNTALVDLFLDEQTKDMLITNFGFKEEELNSYKEKIENFGNVISEDFPVETLDLF